MSEAKRVTSSDLLGLLDARHSDGGWVFFSEVPDRTGGCFHRADALAVSVWPSRGLHLHGFEVKVSRRDWLNELKRPEKAESIGRYCDFWWLVVADPAIVQDGELPSAWGLLAPSGKGLKTLVRATALKPRPIDRPFLCSLLRKFADGQVPHASIRGMLEAEYERGKEVACGGGERAEERLVKLRKDVAAFEDATDLSVPYPRSPETARVKQFVALMRQSKRAERELANAAATLKTLQGAATALEAALKTAGGKDG